MVPYVICHMVTTIDGKILAERWGKRLMLTQDGNVLFEVTAANLGIPAWLIGTRTMREFSARPRGALPRVRTPVPPGDYVALKGAKRFGIGTDAKGVLRFQSNEVGGDHIVVLVTRMVSNDYLAHLRAHKVSYLFCGTRILNLKTALTKIRHRLGLRQLILEGGGTLNGAMLKAGLVDEISQVIIPAFDGGIGVTGIFDIPGGSGKKIAAKLKLVKHQVLPGDISWQRYKVRR